MDRTRYVLGVLAWISYGSGLPFWFLIHPWARAWRQLGPTPTYVTVGSVLAVVAVLVFKIRHFLLGSDLGTHWPLLTIAVVLDVCFWLPVLIYGPSMVPLTIRVRMGVPELSRTAYPQRLVRGGLYERVRHPIYLIAAVSGILYALIVNYVGVYMLFVAAIPTLYLMAVIEERELVDRFGEEYREFQLAVPRFIPRRFKSAARDAPRGT
jgi:protein-S-isoprenylcysteine O-methyltransferase Ste14